MSSLTRHLVRPNAVMSAILFVVAAAFLASAQFVSTIEPVVSDVGAETSYLLENDAAMKKMMNDMEIKPTGGVDTDFVAMMVPHHQGAIEMALAVLRHGRNPQIKRLAQEIIVTQQQEITAMRLAVGQPLPPSVPSPTQVPSVEQSESSSHPRSHRTMEP